MVNFINLYYMKKIIILILIVFTQNIFSQTYIPTKENLEARKWFQEARFGLFIHWGVYSVLGDGEWVMNNQNISINEYKKLPSFFNPVYFDAEEWVLMAKKCRHEVYNHYKSSS